MKKKTVSQLKKQLDKLFSIYIRNKYADWRGNVRCVSCGRLYQIKGIQAGHFVSRGNNSLRYSEDNVFPQCVSCNVFKNGNYPAFSVYLINKFGADYIIKLEKRGQKIKQFTVKELENLIKKYATN